MVLCFFGGLLLGVGLTAGGIFLLMKGWAA